MRRAGALLILVLLMGWLERIPPGNAPGAHTAMVAGLLLLSGYLAGYLLAAVRLPRITGYLCVGLLMGPHILGFLTADTVAELGFLNELAVTFIALAAGGELKIAELRQRMKVILMTIAGLTLIVCSLVALFIFLARPLLPFTNAFSTVQLLAVALLFGVLAVARSPSSAIAIINECRARGPFTEAALGVTVAMDVLVIIFFAGAISFCEAVMPPVVPIDLGFIASLGAEILTGIGAGLVIGLVLAYYIDRVQVNTSILLLGTALLVTYLSHGLGVYLQETFAVTVHLEPLLICVTAGFTVQNYSRQGGKFIEAIEAVSLPVYVLFFALAGAGLDLGALRKTWAISLMLVAVRGGAIFLGAYTGGRLGGDPPRFNRIAGMAFLTQAGVSLGLAMEVVRRFPEWGNDFTTVVVAVIAINQMIGPIAMKQALVRSGEAQDA
jgi:Kef-type K+ transport system membrane component KefB